jgi:hypothetical protein
MKSKRDRSSSVVEFGEFGFGKKFIHEMKRIHGNNNGSGLIAAESQRSISMY